jgi:hypothetical protein
MAAPAIKSSNQIGFEDIGTIPPGKSRVVGQ